jgi:predicted MFS family arabinose efflux permease
MSTSAPAEALQTSASRLMWFFAFVYVAEGLAQTSGILHQPLYYFLMEGLHWDTAQVSAYLGLLGFPWVVKPLYGLVSDCLPLMGYRRKSYLFLVNFGATAALAAMCFLLKPEHIIIALFFIVFGMAVSSALCGALLVEHGKSSGMTSKFCSQQTLWVNIANIAAALIGGWLCHVFAPASALHWSAFIAMFAPLLVVGSTYHLIDEVKTKASVENFKVGFKSIGQALRTKSIWGVAAFLFLWAFNPGFGAPLYAFERQVLHFDQAFIGELAMIYASGAALGGLLYMKVLSPRYSVRTLAAALITSGAAVQASYYFMSNHETAMVLNFFFGLATSMALLNAHVIAANRCPDHAEGFMYGILLSTANLSFYSSGALGGWLYEGVFHRNIQPLILLSAGLTFCCIFLLPFFNFERPTKTKQDGSPATPAAVH